MRYFLPSPSMRIATSDIGSIIQSIIEVLGHLVLKIDQPSFVLPPIVASVSSGSERRHADIHVGGEAVVQHPVKAASREDFRRYDDAMGAGALRPLAQRQHLVAGIR